VVDVRLESALSTIVDFEDSACTVDADDKVAAYANWLGLMKRSLSCQVERSGANEERATSVTRSLLPPLQFHHPRHYPSALATCDSFTLPSQPLLLCRNVGMHMTTDAVTSSHDGAPIPEHFLDAMLTAACALHDVSLRRGQGDLCNSAAGSIYVVKPKMHGPDEVTLAVDLFERVEAVLGLPKQTIKMGIMDEERRTSVNLAQCMHAARHRLVFVNTGFLDRTADEIHTAMQAGPVLLKAALRTARWLGAYEANNVDAALTHGLVGRGQVGKGMWAEPDNMRAMLASKGSQLEMGASTAWVPSPTAATLHALHYLGTSVSGVQARMKEALSLQQHAQQATPTTRGASSHPTSRHLTALLTPPLLPVKSDAAERVPTAWAAAQARDAPLETDASETVEEPAAPSELFTPAAIQAELDRNVQSLLGYVVRWVGQGVGCSKVPTLEGSALMEDRATLRISSQQLANWRLHGLIDDAQLLESLQRVARLVDGQNAADAAYRPLAPFEGPEWHAALELVFGGVDAPNGYTEPALARWRRERKALDAAVEAGVTADAPTPARVLISTLDLGSEVTATKAAPPAHAVPSNKTGYRRRGSSMSGGV